MATFEQFMASHPKMDPAKARQVYNQRQGNQAAPAPAARPTQKQLLKQVPKNARRAVRGDIATADIGAQKQIEYGNADVKTDFGSSSTTYNPETGKYEYTETLSEPNQQILQQGQELTTTGQQLAQQGLQDYSRFGMTGSPEERARIEDEVFSRLTKNYDRDMGRELQTKEQELYNKGIPYSDDPNSRYQKEIRGIQDRYQEAKDSARGQAVMMGGQELQNTFNMGLQSHQQGMQDLTSLQGQGTGLMVQGGPGFQGADFNLTPSSSIGLANRGLNIQKQLGEGEIAAKNAATRSAQQLAAAANQPQDTSGL